MTASIALQKMAAAARSEGQARYDLLVEDLKTLVRRAEHKSFAISKDELVAGLRAAIGVPAEGPL